HRAAIRATLGGRYGSAVYKAHRLATRAQRECSDKPQSRWPRWPQAQTVAPRTLQCLSAVSGGRRAGARALAPIRQTSQARESHEEASYDSETTPHRADLATHGPRAR